MADRVTVSHIWGQHLSDVGNIRLPRRIAETDFSFTGVESCDS